MSFPGEYIFFGPVGSDENFTMIPGGAGWKIKKNNETNSLQIIYLDEMLAEHVVQEFSVPNL